MSFVNRPAQNQAMHDSEPAVDAPERIGGDRGIPSVNTKRRTSLLARILQVVLVLFGLALIAVSVRTLYKKYSAPAHAAGQAPKETNQIKNSQPLDFAKAQPLPAPQPAALMKAPTAPAPPATPVPVAKGPPQQPPVITPAARKLNAGMKFGGSAGSEETPTTVAQPGLGANPAPAGNPSNNPLGQMLSGTKTPMAVATVLPDPNFLLTKGTIVDCIAEAAIDTTQPGMFDCIGSSDVYSRSNKVVLLERGTTYTVEYQRGLNQGQNRIFLLASRAVTPNNVAIDLDSPITDALGRAGLDGAVNTHFWTRFGGSIILGLIGDLGQAAANRASRNGEFSIQNTTRAGQDAASKAIEATINVPPTLEHNQGAHVKLYVARDLDFRSVYDLAAKP
jgi:type IV secretion system protein VirB10